MRLNPLIALLAMIFVLSCNRNIVKLDYTNAKEEVAPLGNLVFRFNKSLVADSMLNRWDSTPYINFSPAIAGRFRWEAPDQLIFSPAKALSPATKFTATITDEVLAWSAFDKVAQDDKLVFSTPSLKLENANSAWVLTGTANEAAPQIDLYFNYAVDPAQLRERVSVTVAGAAVNHQLITVSPDQRITLRLAGIALADKDLQAKVSIDKGLLPKGGSNASENVIETEVMISSPFNLTINDVTTEHNGVSGEVFVKTSQEIIPDNLSSFIKITPAVKFTTEKTDDGFVIRSDQFDATKSYVLELVNGLRGRIGGTLKEDYNNNIAFGELEPSVSFANSKAVYLAGRGNQQVELRIVNVPKIKVIISKIYESNLLHAERYGYYPQDRMGGQNEYYDDEYGQGQPAFGDVIYEQELDTRSLPKYGNSRLLSMNIEDKLADLKGIYHIKVRSATDYWVTDSRFISKSDIGLIAREAKDKLLVFANSLQTAMPLPGVNVVVYGNNNQVIGVGATKEDGVAEVAYSTRGVEGFRPAMIVAKTTADFNYLSFSGSRVNTSRFETGGKTIGQSGLDAFVYAERDIYRPGEKVNFSAIIRDREWKSPGEMPVILRFLLPNGKEFKTFRKTLNEAGSIAGEVDVPVSAITGTYSLEVATANQVLLATKNFSIEEFVPDRIRVTTNLSKSSLIPGDEIALTVNAMNFFGPPAANRNYELEIQLKSKKFGVQKFPSYNFGLQNQGLTQEKIVREGKTDAGGNATESYKVPAMFANMGVLQADFYSTVFDETGRPVSRKSTADVYTQDRFFGIADDGYYYYTLNQPIRFPLLAVDKNQQLLNSTRAEVKIIKHEYRTVLSRAGSYFRYESQPDDKLMKAETITVGGENSAYSFTPRSPGNYEIRIYVPGANAYVSKSFYSYGSWGNNNSSFEVNTEGNIDISLNKTAYEPGETVKALFKAPFNGRMLVTLETDQVLSYQYIDVTNRTASLDLKMTEAHMPNVYITASLIKPHTQTDIPLTVAHGFQSVKVDAKSRQIPVNIVSAKSVRSRTKQQVRVKAAPGSFVTLAAVDNGVLQVSGFETPDPYAHFYAKKALGVNSFDIYPLLFPELKATLSSTGGDGNLSMDKRVNPMPAKRVKLVSYWSGIRKTNGNGEAEFDFEVPQFSGEIRLMAVAYKDNKFGSQATTMTVADPLVLSSSLPRFMSPGDTVHMPVTITNTTAKAGTAAATLRVTGPLKVLGEATQQVPLTANSESRVLFSVAASEAIGTGNIRLEVNGQGEKFLEENDISVRPSAPLQVLTGSGIVNGAGKTAINIPVSDFLPNTSSYKLVISRNPALQLGKQLRYLVQYPYGCTEQIISSAFAQLYFGDIAEQLYGRSSTTTGMRANANYNVSEAIRKIKLRQLYNGGLALWEGEGTEHWWTSVYATHFLIEASRAGFEVDKRLLDGLLIYVNAKLRNKQTVNYYYNQKQQKKIAPKEIGYSLYVLALADRANISVMNYYKANQALLSLDSRYLLSAAYAIGGDKTKFRELLPVSFSGEVADIETGGSFSSPIRDEAVALNALLEVDPSNAQIGVMAKHISDQLNQRNWFNTQESSFSLLALGKMARAAAKSTVTGDVQVNGKTVAQVGSQVVQLNNKQLNGNSITLATKGEGQLYYFWESEGISASGSYKEEDNYLKVRKRFFDRSGNLVHAQNFRQNELVIVELALEKSYSGSVENVVITDMLPAGFEIENPRTREIPGMDWIKNAAVPVALDVRDDRINLFVDLFNNRQVYYYAVRAVTPGVYRMGPVSADAMYNGEYHSYNGGGTIRVVE